MRKYIMKDKSFIRSSFVILDSHMTCIRSDMRYLLPRINTAFDYNYK